MNESETYKLNYVRIVVHAGLDLVEKTIRDFIKKDYIRTKPDGDRLAWYWRHNNKAG